MKRVLFIINSLRSGGAEKILSDILKGFDYSKYDVSLVYFVSDGVYLNDIPKEVSVKCLLHMGPRIDHLFRKFLSSFGLLDTYLRYSMRQHTSKYDTIISYLEGFPTRMHGYIMDKAANNISFIHTDLSSYCDSSAQFSNRMPQDYVYSKMNKLVFVSENAKLGFEKVYPKVLTEKIILKNFIDLNSVYGASKAFKIANHGFTVVSVGRLSKVKGFDIIPSIARELKNRGKTVYFRIVGGGAEESNLKQTIIEQNVENAVFLEGFQKNPYPYIQSADIYISTSHAEGMPLSLCEAMALGKPIISTRTSGAVELLKDELGILVERTTTDFADAIEKLYLDRNTYHTLSERGIQFSKSFDRAVYLEKLYHLL